MKASLFSPLLIIMIITLVVKASAVVSRIEEQTNYALDTTVTSSLIDTAYAKEEKPSEANSEGHQSSSHVEANTESENKSKSESSKKEKEEKSSTKPPISAPLTHTPPKEVINNNLSSSELKLLKELSKRRQELDKNQDDLLIKAQVLKATENTIDQKMAELKSMQSQLEESLKKHDEKEKGKILSLVKIYENMKPRDAAKIFDELEMPLLIDVVSNMKEIKVAPVLANMNPAKARDLSSELAKQKNIGPDN